MAEVPLFYAITVNKVRVKYSAFLKWYNGGENANYLTLTFITESNIIVS